MSPVPVAARVMAAGSHFVAGERVLSRVPALETPGDHPFITGGQPLGSTWCALPCWRQSSDDDAPDSSGSGPVGRGNGGPVKPCPCYLREVGVGRRHTKAPSVTDRPAVPHHS
ncbi:hypothetical protein GCM10023080_063670 [Streptomyces pseudoechinosporeus]